MRTIWYMGAKTRMTDAILAAVERADPRAEGVLDLMCGTGVVARTLAQRYRVVANDVQAYSSTIAAATLRRPDAGAPLEGFSPESALERRFRANADALLELLEPAIAIEDAFLRAYGLEPQQDGPEGGLRTADVGSDARRKAERRVPRDPAERAKAYRAFALAATPTFLEERDCPARGPFAGARALFQRRSILARREEPALFPYHLASSYYPNVYLGLRQAVAVDSLRYAIDGLSGPRAASRRTHCLAALLHAASITTSATSHFCQPRGLVRDAEVKAVLMRRAYSLPGRTLGFADEIAASLASAGLHPENAVRNSDWRSLYADWDGLGRVDVVYADPPYTADNYSRFYHALEVLTHYDYPELQVSRGHTTKGRYPVRGSRHQSPFCTRRGVERELADLCRETAARGAALVLSYGEENGLALKAWREAGCSPQAALRRFSGLARKAYGKVALEKRKLLHSGQGDSNHEVTELLLVARDPRP